MKRNKRSPEHPYHWIPAHKLMARESDFIVNAVKKYREEDPEELAHFLAVVAAEYPLQFYCLVCDKVQGDSEFLNCPHCDLQVFCSEACASRGHGDTVCEVITSFRAASARLHKEKTVTNWRKIRSAVKDVLHMASQVGGKELQALSILDYGSVFQWDSESRVSVLKQLAEKAELYGMPAAAKNFYTAAIRQLSKFGSAMSLEMAQCLFGIGTVVFKAGRQYRHSLALFTMADAILYVLKLQKVVPGLQKDLATALQATEVAAFLQEHGRSPEDILAAANKKRVEDLQAQFERYSVAKGEENEKRAMANVTRCPSPCRRCLPCRKKKKCKTVKAFEAKQRAQRRAANASLPVIDTRSSRLTWAVILQDMRDAVIAIPEADIQETKNASVVHATGTEEATVVEEAKEETKEEAKVVAKEEANVAQEAAEVEETAAELVTSSESIVVEDASVMAVNEEQFYGKRVAASRSYDALGMAMHCGRERGPALRSSSEAILV